MKRYVMTFLLAAAIFIGNVQSAIAEENVEATEENVEATEENVELTEVEETTEENPKIAEVMELIDEIPGVEQLQADFEAGRNHAAHTAAVVAAKAKVEEAKAAYQELSEEDKTLVTNAWMLERFTLIPTPSANAEFITAPADVKDAHVFMHSKNNPYYQHSPHDDRRMYLLVDTSLYGGQEWTPDGGPYDPSAPYNAETGAGNNFVAVYCCDADTGYHLGTYYERINLEDAGYYSEDAAAHIRAVVMNSYPFITGDEMRERLDVMDGADDGKITNKVFKFQNESIGITQTGFTGENVEVNVDDIEDAELLTAVQHVIWGYSNYTDDNDGLTLDAYATHQYDRTVGVESTIYYPVLTKYYQYERDNQEAYDDARKNNISAVAQYLCEKLAPEPIGEASAENQQSQIIISDIVIEKIAPVAGTDAMYQVLVNVELQSRRGTSAIGGDEGDDITITAVSYDADGNAVDGGNAEVKANGSSGYQLQLNVAQNGRIDVDVSGTQYLPLGAYFYAAYDEDGEPEEGESELNPGQNEAQNFVGVAMGNTRIHATASTPYEYKAEEPKEEPKEESKEEPKEEAEEQDEQEKPQTEKQEVIISQGTKTGDESPIGYLLKVLIVAVAGIIGIFGFRKRWRTE